MKIFSGPQTLLDFMSLWLYLGLFSFIMAKISALEGELSTESLESFSFKEYMIQMDIFILSFYPRTVSFAQRNSPGKCIK